MSLLKRFTLFIGAFSILFCVGSGVLTPIYTAQAQMADLETVGETSGLQDTDLRITIARVIRTFLSVLGIIAVIIVLYGGFVWMTARGDADKTDRAKKILINGFIGLVIILASWSITTFVLNTLLDATGGTGTSTSSSSGGARGTYGGGSTTSFAVSGYLPEGDVSIRNIVVRITFSRQVDADTIAGNIVISNTTTGEEVEGTLDVSGNRVSFTPATPCPEPHTDRFCFDESTPYTVTVDSDVKSTAGTALSCTAGSCSSTFTTGTLIDTEDPVASVTYPDSGQSISVDSFTAVQVGATDDSEIATADFYAGDDWFDTVPASGSDLSDVTIESTWYTDDAEEGTSYTLEVTVTDIAGNEDSDSVRIRTLAAHCFDGTQSGDEEGRDCGGSCGACDGGSCSEDDDCSSGTCEAGSCVVYPEIESISPSNGAVGTFVTVSGTGFGSSGSVYFSDASGGLMEADIPSCGDGWSSTEVIVEVPEGAQDGPITLQTSRGYADATDDDQGLLISDFDVNDTQRPSLCNIRPETGEVGDAITLSGYDFGSDRGLSFVSFSPVSSEYDARSASSYSSWSDTSLVATIPTLTAGEYVYVTVTVDGVTSNAISFGVDYGDDVVPTIYSVNPGSGGIGQYVTISGVHFGESLGSVWFEDQTSGYVAQGSIAFPSACSGDIWDDDQITIIVPDTFTNDEDVEPGDYELYVTTRAGMTSDVVDFEITDADPTPGICSISPDTGEVGTPVVIYGDNLGSAGIVTFYGGISATSTAWDRDSISVAVPTGARTGAVSITTAAGEDSNELNFEVGAAAGVSAAALGGGYSWYFSTGQIPVVPRLLIECSDTVVSGVPNLRFTREACTNSIVRGTFSTLMDATTITSGTIKVYACPLGDCDMSRDEKLAAEVPVEDIVLSSSTTQTSFTWRVSDSYNGGNFMTSTMYLVEVDDAILSVGGQALDEEYAWTFTTSSSSKDCDVEEVLVSPVSATIDTLGARSEFNALPLQECLVLDPTDYVWDWDTSPSSYVGLTTCEDTADSYCTSAMAYAEGTTTLIAEETESGTTGQGTVIVNFMDPYVTNYYPSCSSACINGEIGLQFNTVMNDSVVGDIMLYHCANELCATLTEISTVASCSDTAGCSEVTLMISDSTYGTTLRFGEFYRVIVSGSAESTSGVALTRTNYGDDFSWVFSTKDDDSLCTVDRITLEPENILLKTIGATQYYEASAYGGPDDCSVAGQKLSGYSYDWDWTDPIVDEADIAEWVKIASSLFNVGQVNIPQGCTSACLATGSESYYGICGNGRIETGEDCDDGGVANGDGCSSSCQTEASTACTYSCSSTDAACTTDTACREVCEYSDLDPLTGTCSISLEDCSETVVCPYELATCDQDDANCCGDGNIDGYEECDDGNSINGDGCSTTCLNEGSRVVDAVCGNEDIAHEDDQGGEECDDGNASSGDGCSSICLNEGTEAITQIGAECGDGEVNEPYETCDDGNLTNNDGCSSECLREGFLPSARRGTLSSCGDGVVDQDEDTGAGEDCDNREGCSDHCLWEGASLSYTSPSVCGDGVAGTGELPACETDPLAGSDGNIDPVQLAQILDEAAEHVDMDTHLAETTIEVGYQGMSASTSLFLSCTADDDDECEEGYGPATNQCCMVRPDPTLYPNGSNACLNAQIYGLFDMEMSSNTFADSVFVVLDVSTTDDGVCPSSHSVLALNAIEKPWWRRAFDIFVMIVAPMAQAQATGDCALPLTGFTQTPTEDGQYKVVFNYNTAMEPDARYTIYVLGDTLGDDDRDGVLTKYGVAMDGDRSQSFETYQSLCGLDEVDIVDGYAESPDLFTATGQEHVFTATAYSYDTGTRQSIESISGVYAWGWTSWSSDDVAESILEQGTESVGTVDESSSAYTAAGTSGDVNISTSAVIVEDSSGDSFTCSDRPSVTCSTSDDCRETCSSSGRCSVSGDSCTADEDCDYYASSCDAYAVAGTADVTALVCENPWPAIDYFPFEDNADGVHTGTSVSASLGVGWMNFSTYYCRDRGSDEMSDDYPELRAFIAQESGTADVLKEYFFNVIDGNIATGDAIGIRIVENDEYLSPLAWYRASGFSGDPSETTVDGFQAVVDGRSTYVAVPNYASGSLYPNIVILSYNYGAGSDTIAIFKMLLENMSFVTNLEDTEKCYSRSLGSYNDTVCTSDIDCKTNGYQCGSEKLKLQRDMRRLTDITDLMSAVGLSSPQITSGSYVRSLTSSVWGSWDAVLAEALGTSVAADPLNQYRSCGVGRYRSYDSLTCVNETTGAYVCPEGSYTYHYRAVGESGLQVGAELEYRSGSWLYDIDTSSTDNVDVIIGARGAGDGFENGAAFCDGTTVWGVSDTCGDGIVGSGETCEVDDSRTGSTACDSNGDGVNDGYYLEDCNSACTGYTRTTTCVVTTCGNGVIETGEDCDDGSLNGSYGFCGADCRDTSRTYCGDGTLAGGEVCDCGSSGAASGAAYGGGVCSILNGVYGFSASSTCAWDCLGPGPYCGDADVDDAEACDGNTDTYSGKLCRIGSSTDGTCEADSDCVQIVLMGYDATGTCGGTSATDACPNTTVCVDGDTSKIGLPCTTDSYCNSSTGGDGICSTFTYQTTRTRTCDDSSCTWAEDWDDISCRAPGSCGDGVLDSGEECDDGNDDSTDSCTVECTSNICGDGYIYAGEESCDEGDQNGIVCTASYGSTCTYCNELCRSVSSSGSFCGNGVIDGSEVCDLSDVPYHVVSLSTPLTILDTCDPSASGTIIDGGICYPTGVCNGGTRGGEYCTTLSSDPCGGGDCVLPDCNASCSAMCPFTYASQSIAIKTNQLGASRAYSADLAPYDSSSRVMSTGNSSTLYIPACSVADGMRMTISDRDREYPDVEIMFVLDLSKSMDSTLGSSTRIDVLRTAVNDAVTELYNAYDSVGATMGIGWAYIGGGHGDDFLMLAAADASGNPTSEEAISTSMGSDMSTDADTGTPIYESIEEAMLGFSGYADKEYMIVFTDGNIYNTDYSSLSFDQIDTDDTDGDGVVDNDEYMRGVSNLIDDVKDAGVEVFTAVLTGDSCDIVQMQRWSSMDCAETSGSCRAMSVEGNHECSIPENGITYAYSGTTSEELEDMYEQIVDSILNITVSLTFGGETASTTIDAGIGRIIALPSTFTCDQYNEQNITLRTAFNGSGTIEVSDIYMDMCAQ